MIASGRLGIGLFAVAALPRLVYLAIVRPPFEGLYWALASGVLHDGSLAIDGVKTTYFDPLYPLFLAFSRLLVGDHVLAVQALQGLVASLGAVYMYRLANALTGRQRIATLGAAAYAAYPLLVHHAVAASEFGLMSVFLIAFAYGIVTATNTTRATLAGLWLGLAILTRTEALPLVAVGAALLIISRPGAALPFALAAAAVCSPLAIRNYSINGAILPTRSGVNLFISNSRYSAALLPTDSPDVLGAYVDSILALERPDLVGGNADLERDIDDYLTTRTIKEVRQHPSRTLALKARNLLYFFSPRLVPARIMTSDTRVDLMDDGRAIVTNNPPRPVWDDVSYTVSYSLVLVAACGGIWLRRRQLHRDGILWCIAATIVAVHVIYFPATRYRVPMSFVLLFYAAVGLDALVRMTALTTTTARARTARAVSRDHIALTSHADDSGGGR